MFLLNCSNKILRGYKQGSSLHNEYLKFNCQYGTAPAAGRWLIALFEISPFPLLRRDLAWKTLEEEREQGDPRTQIDDTLSFSDVINILFPYKSICSCTRQTSPYLKAVIDWHCAARKSLPTPFIILEDTCYSCRFLNNLVCNRATHPEYLLSVCNRYLSINLAVLKFNLAQIPGLKSPFTDLPPFLPFC